MQRGPSKGLPEKEWPTVSRELKEDALEGYRALLESGESKGYGDPEFDDPQLSFQLAQAVQDMDFQSVLLRDRSEASRLPILIIERPTAWRTPR